jgi:hypothetical protein
MALIRKELREHYGTSHGPSVREQIIFELLQALMQVHYPVDRAGTKEHATMQKLKRHWKWSQKKSPG